MTENSNFFIKQGYDSSKLKTFAKDMLAKTRNEVLSQNEKKTKRKDNNSYNDYWNIYPKYFKKNIINILRRASNCIP